MVFNKFALLTRQSLGKTLTHVPQTFVAGTQSSYSSSTSPFTPFGSHASGKFGKAGNAHLHTSFQGPSSPAAAQGKSGQAASKDGSKNDSGLAAYYDAWQKQHQPGVEEKEWKQFQFTKRIGWKAPTAAVLAGRAREREERGLKADARLEHGGLVRAYSTSAVDDIKESSSDRADAEALVRVDEAIAKEITDTNGSVNATNKNSRELLLSLAGEHGLLITSTDSVASTKPPVLSSDVASNESISSSQRTLANSIQVSGELGADSAAFSKHIVTLKDTKHYAEIPPVFELMLAEGVPPTSEAYNGLLAAAINMPMEKHQRVRKALGIYTNMLEHKVSPDADFHNALIQLLASRALYVLTAMKSMNQQRMRYGGSTESNPSLFKSKDAEYEILAEDSALATAIRIFNLSVQSSQDQQFSSEMYRLLITACAANGKTDEMLRIYNRMETYKIMPTATIFPPMIEALGNCGDLATLVKLYDGYRDLAISNDKGVRAMDGREDNQVYAAVIKAYARWDRFPGGERFLTKILDSYEPGTEDRQGKIEATQDAVFVNAFIQQHLDSASFSDAFKVVEASPLTDKARDEAFANISVAAADSNMIDLATNAYGNIHESSKRNTEAAIAMLALHIRQGEIELARGYWSSILAAPQIGASFVEPAAMYVTALVQNGLVDEALTQSREAFARIRESASARTDIVEEIDEAIEVIGATVAKAGIRPSGPAVVDFFRAMVENRGLVTPIAEEMMAGLGYEEILDLSVQDLTLVLQAQADMIAHRVPQLDVGHADRFAHLIGLVRASRIAPDRSTFKLVERAAQQLSSQRPELLTQWQNYQQSFITPPYTPVPYTPQPMTPVVTNTSIANSYDPYAATTDIRGSNIMADVLDSHRAGTLAALNEALSRLRDMRRIGRHPRYIVYSKLITAAAKERRTDIIRDMHALAEQDIPLVAHYPTVRHGWTLILDAMVAAWLTVGKRALAGDFHQELLKIGSAPSANTFGLYITTLKESAKTSDEASEAVRIFHQAQSQGVEPSSFLYNALIGKLGKARRINDCLGHFTEMRKLGIRPTSVTYGTIVNALCRVSEERQAEDLFEEMEGQSNYKPRPAPYNSLMQFFLTAKCDSAKVLAYYERMKSSNIQPTMHTYKLLIDTYATLEPIDFAAAEGVLKTIRASGQKPEAVHYASLIHAKGCNLKDMDGAKQLFDAVINKGEVAPQACLYQALFESMVADHNMALAEPMLEDMAARGVSMTPYIANSLIHGWANANNIDGAKDIYDSIGMAKREPSTYEAMTRAYLTTGNRAGAIEVVNEMKSRRYPSAVENKVLDLLGPDPSQAASHQSTHAEILDAQYA